MHYTIIQAVIAWLINAAFHLEGGRPSDPLPVTWHNTFVLWRSLLYGTKAITEQGNLIRRKECIAQNIIPLDHYICTPQPSKN